MVVYWYHIISLRIINLLFCMFVFAVAASGQNVDFKADHYSVKEGLVHNMVNKVIMDKIGFLWIATEGGLSRFDGTNFTNFNLLENKSVQLPNLNLLDMDYDGNRTLFISSQSGLFSFDIITFKIKVFKYSALNQSIWQSAYDSANRDVYFISATNKILYKYSVLSDKLDSFPSQKLTLADDILFFQNKIFLAQSRKGLYVFDIKTKRFREHYNVHWIFRLAINDENVYALAWQNDNFIYNTVSDSFFRLKTLTENTTHFNLHISTGICKSSLVDKDLAIVSTNTGGLLIYNLKDQKILQIILKNNYKVNGLKSNRYNCLFKDRFENIWLGTWDGLTKINPNQQQFKSEELEFAFTKAYNLISGIVRDRIEPEIIWVASNGSGIIKYNSVKEKKVAQYFDRVAADGTDYNYDYRWTEFVKVDKNNTIWSGGYTGLVAVREGKELKYDFLGKKKIVFVSDLFMESDDIFWVTTNCGLVKFYPKTGKYIWLVPLGKGDCKEGFNKIVKLNTSEYLISGYQNPYIFNSQTETFKPIVCKLKGVQTISNFTTMAYDSINTILYLGNEAGVYFKRKDAQEFNKIEYIVPIIPAIKKSLLVDRRGILWIYSAQALYSFNPKAGDIRRYNQTDGIYTNYSDPPVLFEFENNIHIGYRAAITKFDPLKTGMNNYFAEPVFTKLSISGKDTNIDFANFTNDFFEISYSENSIRIEFTGINYNFPEKTTFYYWLEGADGDWLKITDRHLTFTKLKSGKYKLKIKAVNSDGKINEKFAQFNFLVTTPFWKSTGFFFICGLIILLLAYLLYRFRVNKLKALLEVRNTISRDLHDNIGATISSAGYTASILKNNLAEDINNIKLISKIQYDLKTAGESIDETIWSINPINDNWEQLLSRLRRYGSDLLEVSDIEYQFVFDNELVNINLPTVLRKEIFYIYKEALNNIIKHSKAKNVKVEICLKQSKIVLAIIDDGVGFDVDGKTNRNGLKNMFARVARINGQLEIESGNQTGTRILLSF